MIKYLFPLLFLAACTSAPTIGCNLETTVSNALSTKVASTLSCTNQAAIESDMMAALGKANLCTKAADTKLKGAIGNIICPVAVGTVLNLIGSKVPTSWGCDPSKVISDIGPTLTTACSNAVGI